MIFLYDQQTALQLAQEVDILIFIDTSTYAFPGNHQFTSKR